MRLNQNPSTQFEVITAISHLLSPLLLASTLILFFSAQHHGWNLATVFAWMSGARIVLMLLIEFNFPAKLEWQMTRVSFRRDLKYIAINGGVTGLLKLTLAWLALDLSNFNTGIIENIPIWVELVILFLVYEFFQYWYHRLSHEGRGSIGLWLWRNHVAHHLPDRVYLLMHPVAHPLNLLISIALLQFPLIVLGAKPETVFLFNALIGLQGLLSHFNVNVKAGWLNYFLVGTELHRFHHSANLEEAKNYGVFTPFWDLIFGTFAYSPYQLPVRLGVVDPENYPNSMDIGKVLALPFNGSTASPKED